jgi:hypothetical protein
MLPDESSLFVNPMHADAMRHDGYFLWQMLDEEDLRKFRELFAGVDPRLNRAFYSTIDSTDHDYRTKVDLAIRERLEAKVSALFKDYYPLIFNFIVKAPSDSNKVGLHVDDTHVDESRFRTFNIWCPLIDTYPENGGLYVWPGSHRLPYPPRGYGLPYPYLEHSEQIERQMIPVYQKAGQAVVYSNRLMHLSYPNKTDQIRPAIITGMLPVAASPEIYFRPSGMPVGYSGVYKLSKSFYIETDRDRDPDSALLLRKEKFHWEAMDEFTFTQACKAVGLLSPYEKSSDKEGILAKWRRWLKIS